MLKVIGNFKDTPEFKDLRRRTELAFKAVVKKVIEDHRKEDLPIVVFKNGKIVYEKPWEVDAV